jgi:protein ImuB
LVLVESGARGLILVAGDRLALARGLKAGERLADARARVPDLASGLHEPERDAAMLLRLSRWAERWSPAVMPDAPDGLLLDATGVAHLFGGEAMLVADIKGQCARLRFTAIAAIAGNPPAARALARFARLAILGPGDERDGLAPLPVAALGLDGETCHTLARLGLRTIGDLCRVPRSSLARRFRGDRSAHVLKALDQALGLVDTPLIPLCPAPAFVVRHCVMDPIVTPEGIEAVLTLLAQTLGARLADAGHGALRVALKLYRTDASRAVVPAGLARPSRDPRHLTRLIAPRLAGIDLGFGVDAATLEALATAPLDYRQGDLDGAPPAGGIELAMLADRIANRPDGAALAGFRVVESHLPERAGRFAPPGFGEAPQPRLPPESGPPGAAPARPLVLFDRPEEVSVLAAVPDGPPVRFTWRRLARRVVRADGPERIAPEWWTIPPGTVPPRLRDYYVVEDEDGRRYWLYREGLYGEGAEASPRWFVHGLFA